MIHSTLINRRGYTLLEILIAVTLMMMIMLGVTQLFSSVGTQINNAQATLSMAGNLRSVKTRLEKDLALATADLTKAPPMKAGINNGYFCIIEGMGAAHNNALLRTRDFKNPSESITTQDIAYSEDSEDLVDNNTGFKHDNTVGDMDDIIMFTAYAPEGQPFRGRYNNALCESAVAEIIWFCRGNTLYRRTLLIKPDAVFGGGLTGFYDRNDISARYNAVSGSVVANSLEDLSLRQNRFAHLDAMTAFPFNIHKNSACYYFRMPTLQETTHSKWDISKSYAWNFANSVDPANAASGPVLNYADPYVLAGLDTATSNDLPKEASSPFIDFWDNPFPWKTLGTASGNETSNIDQTTGVAASLLEKENEYPRRYAEDMLMTNVISFDVQVWDDVAKRYVSLGEAKEIRDGSGIRYEYNDGKSAGPLGTQGNYPLLQRNVTTGVKIATVSSIALPCVYDTWSEEYEREGYSWPNQFWNPSNPNQNMVESFGRDLKDNNGNGVIDEMAEWTTPPPYNVPLRGVKVLIRTFDPLSKNVREVTVIHDFTGK